MILIITVFQRVQYEIRWFRSGVVFRFKGTSIRVLSLSPIQLQLNALNPQSVLFSICEPIGRLFSLTSLYLGGRHASKTIKITRITTLNAYLCDSVCNIRFCIYVIVTYNLHIIVRIWGSSESTLNLDITVKGMIVKPPGGARELISVGDDTMWWTAAEFGQSIEPVGPQRTVKYRTFLQASIQAYQQ